MKCPNCNTAMETDKVHLDYACPGCGLAGPRSTLEDLAKDLSPSGVMDAAEHLLRKARVTRVHLHPQSAALSALRSPLPGGQQVGIGQRFADGRRVADAYATLIEPPAPEMTPERVRELEQDETAAQHALRVLGVKGHD